jgi:superfamily II RNA helicase
MMTEPTQAEPKVEAKVEEVEKEATLADLLTDFTDSPSKETIEDWKQEHGEVLCSGFSETELLVWRPITRGEFVDLQTMLAAAETQVSSFELEKTVVEMCVLWASPSALLSLEKKAGSLTTVNEQIMQNSNFMDPRMASSLVIKL